MNFRAGLVGFIFLIWLVLCSYYYMCVMHGHCFQRSVSAATPEVGTNNGLPPETVWTFDGSDEVIVGDSFGSELQLLVDGMFEDDVLNISGHYLSEEQNGFNRAFRRAMVVKELATRFLDTSKIRMDVLSIARNNERGDTFEAVSLNIVGSDAANVSIDPPTDAPWQSDDEPVVKPKREPVQPRRESFSGGKKFSSVLFKPGTVVKKLSSGQEEQLRDFVVRMIDSKEQIYVIGHSYRLNGEEENYQMGRKRAWAVKKLLWDMGLDPNRITTDSKGTKEPLSNDGADRNERTDIFTKNN